MICEDCICHSRVGGNPACERTNIFEYIPLFKLDSRFHGNDSLGKLAMGSLIRTFIRDRKQSYAFRQHEITRRSGQDLRPCR